MSLRSRQIDELEACFVVKDATSHKLGYFYYEEEPGRRSAAKLLTTSTIRYALKELLPSGNLRHQSGE